MLNDVASLRTTVEAVASRVELVDRDSACWLNSIDQRLHALEHPRPGPLRRLWRRIVNLVNFEPEKPTC